MAQAAAESRVLQVPPLSTPLSKLGLPGLPTLSTTLPRKPALPPSLAGLLPAEPLSAASPNAAAAAPTATTEGGLSVTADSVGTSSSSPFYHYPAPAENSSNPQPFPSSERRDQVVSYTQKVRPQTG